MDAETYPHAAVRAELALWVFDRVDIEGERAAAELLQISAVPVAVALAPDGSVLQRFEGFFEAKKYAELLSELRSSRSFR